ncbi:flagellar biosynthesis protein FlhA [Terriglobus saanensis]|uniref:Flagellar biosynthesis protein FlhA n=1 Tax=Terriglobus saanensis (strain ATCC BAA-1853 / DSM 23119 / SP1PR4) TaxID=401053 RepID=E8V505_TERSS|nr:flagellar biosynthesis protein FlhA [Terriglobus saanensis]ADV82633.1 flagellar biosynthesis protein FlhA [Terriglobus saanensis SP1PR4]
MTSPMEKASGSSRFNQILLPVTAISMVFVMLVPVPSFVLDLLLALSIAASVMVFLTAVQVRKATELSVFPTLLLLLTLFRLSLNLASSRMILLHGQDGTHAAGSVIEAFGQFVVGGNYVVGFVLFLALTAIQFLVVSHGAVRTAEVTARFTLDALPGKQMAIDADMNAGLIDEHAARKRREVIAREAEFYGAMDGAARFNQRDALATILITAINIIAGLLIGVIQQGVDLAEAVKTYTILTVGDGLVTMIPSLLVSIAGGMILTRASSAGSLDEELGTQLFAKGKTLWIGCGVLVSLALVPGLPKLAFLLMAVGLGLLAKRADTSEAAASLQSELAVEDGKGAAGPGGENLASLLRIDELTLEIGFQLIPLVDEAQGGQMLNRVRALRRHLATELGFIVPSVHITDNLRLKPREYVISLRGTEIARWQTEQNFLLAVNSDPKARPLAGIETREPAFGVAARWIQPGLEEEALASGYSVVDQATVIGTHLAEMIRRHAYELLGRAETKRLLDSLNESHPKLIEELVPKLMSLGEVQRVLQQLLREQVSIRDLGTVLETMVEVAQQSKALVHMVESIRQSLGRRLVHPLLDSNGNLEVMTLNPQMEAGLVSTFSPESSQLALEDGENFSAADFPRRLLESLKKLTGNSQGSAIPVLLCPSPARYHVRRWLEPLVPRITVLAPSEIPPGIRVRSLGMIG